MAGIYGLSSLVLDNKGRIAMPARYKEQLKELAAGSLIVTKDPQYPSLLIYPGNLWKEISNSFEKLSRSSKLLSREFERQLPNHAGTMGCTARFKKEAYEYS